MVLPHKSFLKAQKTIFLTMSSTKSENKKLKDPYFKQLLLDIESSNVPLEDITFGTICRLRPKYYDITQEFKKKYNTEFKQIKRQSQENYLKLLKRSNIEPGPALKRKLGKEKGTALESIKDKEEEETISQFTESKSSSLVSSNSSFSSLSSEETASLLATTLSKTLTFSPQPSKTRKTPSKHQLSTMFSPSIGSVGSATVANPIMEVLENVEKLSKIRQEGTIEYPFIHHVNLEYPERNRGFDIVRVEGVEHNGFIRTIFHIRKEVPFPTIDEHQAFIPTDRYPSLAHRAVMIKMPSQSFWHRSTALYHHE